MLSDVPPVAPSPPGTAIAIISRITSSILAGSRLEMNGMFDFFTSSPRRPVIADCTWFIAAACRAADDARALVTKDLADNKLAGLSAGNALKPPPMPVFALT